MEDLEHLDSEAAYDPLSDPDVYVLVPHGRPEAIFTDAELSGLAVALTKVARLDRDERRRGPQKGVAAALHQIFNGATGGAADVDVLAAKVSAVVDRLLERQGYGPMRARLRGFLRPDGE